MHVLDINFLCIQTLCLWFVFIYCISCAIFSKGEREHHILLCVNNISIHLLVLI